MLTFFKTCFNILRNISFAVVLAIVGCFTWIWTDEEAKQEFADVFNKETIIAENKEEERNDEFIFEDEDFVEEENEGFGIQAFQNEDDNEKVETTRKVEKVAIDRMKGNSRVRLSPSEIMYYCRKTRKKGYLEDYIIKIDETRINTKSNPDDIYDKLERIGIGTFFKTRYHVINCLKVIEDGCHKQGESNHRKCWAIMENKDTIYIDKNKYYSVFSDKMNEISH